MNLNSTYSDIAFVEGVYACRASMQEALYCHCRTYFYENYGAIFFAQDADLEDIFENTFITLWQNIEHRKIYVENGILKGRNGQPFVGTLTTYMMGIAALKYREWVRSNVRYVNAEDMRMGEELSSLMVTEEWTDNSDPMWEVTSECVSHLSERCHEILTLFYDQEMTLDEILVQLPSFTSKDALKTAKNKCLNKLRESSRSLYEERIRG